MNSHIALAASALVLIVSAFFVPVSASGDHGHEEPTYSSVTTIEFSRPLRSCDTTYDRDLDLTAAITVLYAYKSNDPDSQAAVTHHDVAGTATINLLLPEESVDVTNTSCATPNSNDQVTQKMVSFDQYSYDQSQYLDAGLKFLLCWSVDQPNNKVTFAMQVVTGGWVGLGFPSNATMENADLFIGWVTDAEAINFADRFSASAGAASGVSVDASQGFYHVYAKEEEVLDSAASSVAGAGSYIAAFLCLITLGLSELNI